MFNVTQVSSWIEAQHANASEAKAAALFSSLEIKGVASLKDAGPADVTFFFSKNYIPDLMKTRAGVIITGTAFVNELEKSGLPQWKTSVFLAAKDPYAAMATVSGYFSKLLSAHDHQVAPLESDIHPTAVIHPTVNLGNKIKVGAYCVIEAHSKIKDSAVIYPHCYVGPHSEVGEGSVLFPRVTLYEKTQIGKRCRIHSGSTIGGDGFGYAPHFNEETKLPDRHIKIYHLGSVVIEDDVEIGANSTIDRGTLGETRIQKMAKVDNLVQIGHNCNVGEGAILCGCAGMAGSSSLGKFVVVGAQSGTSNQVHVGNYAKLAGYTGAAKDVEPGAEVAGVPARPLSDLYKILAIQNKLLRERKKGRE